MLPKVQGPRWTSQEGDVWLKAALEGEGGLTHSLVAREAS